MTRNRDVKMFNEYVSNDSVVNNDSLTGAVPPQVRRSDAHPHGRYGWYVDTSEGDGEHTIYVGEYISVTSNGDLLIWGRDDRPIYRFPLGRWRFVLPQFDIKQWRKTGEGAEFAARPLPAFETEPSAEPESFGKFKLAAVESSRSVQ